LGFAKKKGRIQRGNRRSKPKEEQDDAKGYSEVENQRRTGGYKGVIGSRKPKKNRRMQKG
jgi:hypothetical protein